MADLVGGTPAGLGFRTGLTYISVMLRMRKKATSGLPSMPARRGLALDLCDLEDLVLLQQRSDPA
jgi:hypothetical protein